MKLSRWQIVALLAAVWLYTSGFGKNIFPSPTPFVADMEDENLEGKVIAAMLLIADDNAKPEIVAVETIEVAKEEPKIVEDVKPVSPWDGRFPRAIVLTDLTSCSPCINYENNTIKHLRAQNFKDLGWSVGNSPNDIVEVVDINKDPEKFDKYFTELATSVDKTISPATPTTIFINKNGEVELIKVGGITLSTFLESIRNI